MKTISATPDGEVYTLTRYDDGRLRAIWVRAGGINVRVWHSVSNRGRLNRRARRVLEQLGYADPEKLLKPVDINQSL